MTTIAMPREQYGTERRISRPASMIPDNDWQAIASRDANRDGQFVYGVRTTRIYCRPSCPSRLPRRDHVELFRGPALAEDAGFRPCKRCDPALDSVTGPGVALVQRACAYMDAHLDDALPLTTVARAAHGSPAHLQRTFKRVLGISPRAYVAAKREERLRGALRTGQSVGRAVFEAGYASARPVYGAPAAPLGMTPATYRKGGAGATIRYTIIESALGHLLVGATDRGICCVQLGDRPDTLKAGLRSEFPAATLEHEPGPPRPWVTAIRASLTGNAADDVAALPLECPRHCFSAPSVGCPPPDSLRRNADVHGDRTHGRRTRQRARRRTRLRDQSRGDRRPLPPRHPGRRSTRWVPVGPRAQGSAARSRRRCTNETEEPVLNASAPPPGEAQAHRSPVADSRRAGQWRQYCTQCFAASLTLVPERTRERESVHRRGPRRRLLGGPGRAARRAHVRPGSMLLGLLLTESRLCGTPDQGLGASTDHPHGAGVAALLRHQTLLATRSRCRRWPVRWR